MQVTAKNHVFSSTDRIVSVNGSRASALSFLLVVLLIGILIINLIILIG